MTRDGRHRGAPRPLALALDDLGRRLAPATALGRAQSAWADAVGDTVAAAAQPTSERGGVLTVTCSSSVWAQELDLMAATVVESLNRALGEGTITALRCRTG